MSDAKLEHTPLPWKQVSREGKIGVDIRGANGRAVAATFGVANQPKSRAGAQAQAREDRANAELIVAAVNSYPQREAMRSALEAIVAVGPPVRGVDELWSSWQARKFAAYELARAALEVK